jgi:alanine racemase
MNIQDSQLKQQAPSISNLSWVQLDKAAFLNNIAIVRQLIGSDCTFGLVVKANAYGHGLEQVSMLAEQLGDVDYICTATLTEALQVRAAGVKKPILVLAIVDQSIELAILNGIDLVVYNKDLAEEINNVAARLGQKASVHIKIDTGLSRLGFQVDEASVWLQHLVDLQNLNVVGVFTHFAEADNQNSEFTKLQQERFGKIIAKFKMVGVVPSYVHCANSSATVLMNVVDCKAALQHNFVRVGGLAYGLVKSKEIEQLIFKKTGRNLKQVLSLQAKIIQIKKIKVGEYIGYGRTAKAETNLTLAIVPVGYADGYPRELSNKGFAYVGRHKVKVVGRISMNMVTLDVTALEAKVGNVVELIGNRPGITVKDLALAVGTIDYEVTTRLNSNFPKLF